MATSIPEFWRLLTESRLLTAEQCEQLGDSFAPTSSAQPADSEPLAQWLVSQNVISRYQARILVSGRPGPFIYGNYKIYDRIEQGRLNGVFRAVHSATNHPVTLYFLTHELAQDSDRWALVNGLPRIDDPLIVRCLQVVDLGSYKYLVWEDLRGTSLDQMIQNGRPVPLLEACRMVQLAAAGLARLHQERPAHGDLRPSNLWLERSGNVKLLVGPDIDLGPLSLTESGGSNSAAAAHLLRRADYLAPELAQPGRAPSVQSDIYALGCTLYELIVGRVPFMGGTVREKLHRHTAEPLESIGSTGAPQELAQTIATMMAKKPHARFQQAAVVAQQLEPFARQAGTNISPAKSVPSQAAFDQWLQEQNVGRADGPIPIAAANAAPSKKATGITASASHVAADVPEIQISGAVPVGGPTRAGGSTVAERVARSRTQRRTTGLLLVVGIGLFALLSGAVLIVLNGNLLDSSHGSSQGPQAENDSLGSIGREAQSDPRQGAGAEPVPGTGENGEQLLWASPTAGPPIELQQLPGGAQVFLVARPADILDLEEGQRVLKALGPDFAEARAQWERASGFGLSEVDQLTIGLYGNAGLFPRVACVVQPSKEINQQDLLARWGSPATRLAGEATYYAANGWAFHIPQQTGGSLFVMGDEELIQEAAQSDGRPPLLRRELGSLLRASDQQRHVTLLFAPNFLFSDGRALFSGARQQALDPVEWLLGDTLKAGMVSAHFSDPFYIELRMQSDIVMDRFTLAADFRDRLGQIPDAVESYIAALNPHPYWRLVAFRFPGMVRFLGQQLRVGVDGGHALVNVALPESAPHNLIFGTEMALASTPGASVLPETAVAKMPQTIDEMLASKMSISFDQDSLEASLRNIEAEVSAMFGSLPFEFKIQILGDDLESEGITRNQQIRDFNQADQTVAEILTAISIAANPVKNVKPSEEDQKLLWVIGPNPANPSSRIILFTTRQAAKEKYSLPAPFRSE